MGLDYFRSMSKKSKPKMGFTGMKGIHGMESSSDSDPDILGGPDPDELGMHPDIPIFDDMDKLKQIEEDMAQIKKISKRATSKKTAAKKKKPEEIKEVVKEEEEKQPIKPPSGLDPSLSKVESSEPAKVLDKIDEKDEGEAEDAPMEEAVDMNEAYDSALYD